LLLVSDEYLLSPCILLTCFLQSRSVYRIIEFSHAGGNPYINAHEWTFYVFDAVPVCGKSSALSASRTRY
jgi:hypothetical protein